MTTQEKLNKIYEVMADKTLSFGCITDTGIVLHDIDDSLGDERIGKTIIYNREGAGYAIQNRAYRGDDYDFGIIGHPVMIGDVFQWMESQQVGTYKRRSELGEFQEIVMELVDGWLNKRKPFNDQSDNCIDFIYSLLPEDDKKQYTKSNQV